MCDPYSLAIMVGSKLASSALSGQAAHQVGRARQQVEQNAENDLQKYRSAATQSYNQSFDASTPGAIQAGMDKAVADRGAIYQNAIPDAQTIVPAAGSAAAKGSIAKALAVGNAYSKNLAVKRAGSEGFGAATANRDLTLDKSATDIGVQGNFARGRQALVPLQFQVANNAGARNANLAGIVDALGNVGAMASGPITGSAPGYDASSGITWNMARVPSSIGVNAARAAQSFGPYLPA